MIRTIRRLSLADLAMLAKASMLLVGVRVALWVLPYRWVCRAMTPRVGSVGPSGVATEAGRYRRRVVWAVDAAARRMLPRKPCLTQALVARWLLARGGYLSELRIGVAFGEDRALLAHAWLEHEGRVIIGGTTAARYTPLAPLREGITV